MELSGKVVVVTGGAQGIGEAMCRRFASDGAAGIVVADVDARAQAIAGELGSAHAVIGDVAREADVMRIVAEALNGRSMCSPTSTPLVPLYRRCWRPEAATCCRPRPLPDC
jgi:NAD(P)-dependent dehydrogenase (short-subunit alcohol dehydrogenase family)